MAHDRDHDIEAALRIVTVPLAALLQELENKGILTPGDTAGILQAGDACDVCGPLSAKAHDMIENLHKSLEVCRSLPVLNR